METPTPKSQAQTLSELEATLKALLVVLKNTIQVNENAEVSQERIQDLIEKIEQIEVNPTEISELTTAIEQLVIYIQKIPKTDLNPLSTKLDQLERQVRAIPTSPPSKPNLSNLVTKSEIEELTQIIRQKENVILTSIALIALMVFGTTMWIVADIKSKLEEQIQQVPAAIQQYQTQLKEDAAEAAKTKKQNRKKSNR
jgi:hypothetical protein